METVDPNFIQWLISQAGLGAVAAMALWLYSKLAADAIRRERENSEQTRLVNSELLRTLNENTRALAALESAIKKVANDR